MPLFSVDGWDIKAKNVALGGGSNKQKEKKKDQKKQKKEKKRQVEDQDESEEVPVKKPKKEKLEKLEKLEKSEIPQKMDTPSKLTPLQQKMMAKLSGSRFRWINEQLYTSDSESALRLIKEQPALFDEYHQGFRSQVQLWPENPVDVFVDQFRSRMAKPVSAPGGLPGLPDRRVVVADMGCGEAQLARDVNKIVKEHNGKIGKKGKRNSAKPIKAEVHSFDLKKANELVTVADIKNVPLEDGSCSIVIFCLALMGTNFLDFVEEAYRLLAPNGELWIAEIKSRFSESANSATRTELDIGNEFVESLKLLGFFHKKTDNENKMFTRFEFFKPSQEIINQRKEKLERKKKFIEQETQKEELDRRRSEKAEGLWLLKPCIYKRR